MKFTILISSFLSLFLGCIQFKVDVLKPDLITKIQIGSETSNLQVEVVNNVLTNLPLTIPFQSGTAYLTDTKRSIIKGFDSQGELETIIGSMETPPIAGVNLSKYRFGTLGLITLDSNQNLYIQNRFGNKEGLDGTKEQDNLFKKYSGSFETSGQSPLPSYIIKMNSRGEIKSVIGASGKNTEPFRYIEFIQATDSGKLFVYHKIAEEMRLSYYQDEELKSEIREGSLDIFKSGISNEYVISLDKIYPQPAGEYALASISYYSKGDNRFKFRRIYKIDFDKPTQTVSIKEIQDPAEILFSVRENDEFYIWETEDSGASVRLQVHDPEGNHINNKRLVFTSPRGQWRETFTDGRDNIYSIRIRAGFLELHRWR
ncbi:LIC_12708 family protein [Leptospira sp. GIMC2001]|uniref:LIC_12708 family protein n=1 Tax=Leptospira sp. GIMC2001 TaxID=1513297 RepID=UPI00234A0F0B|nr:hypothetical protein [Leptospira sp. GIMC2001]WCL48092.1 hypothetical protein O4O04_12285 [Leptospira sp. GIMC2001]